MRGGGVAWMQTGAVQSYSYGTGGAEVNVPLADDMGNVRHERSNQAIQDAYDEDTSHGLNTAAQAAWETHLRARVNRMAIPQAPPTPPGLAGF